MEFAALCLNPLGGIGPKLAELLDKVWAHRLSEASAAGYDTRKLNSKYRRAMEKLSAEMVRCAHRAIHSNTTGRGSSSFSPPPTTDIDEDLGEMNASQ